jgi:hypothetical protein
MVDQVQKVVILTVTSLASEMCELEPRSELLSRSLLEGLARKGREGGKLNFLLFTLSSFEVRTLGAPNKVSAQNGEGCYIIHLCLCSLKCKVDGFLFGCGFRWNAVCIS